MDRKSTDRATTIATVAVAALLVASAVGMGTRQLRREGVFSETQSLVQTDPVESEKPAIMKAAPEPRAEDEKFLARIEPEMEGAAFEQEMQEVAVEAEPAPQQAPRAAAQSKLPAEWQKVQIVKGGYEGKSPEAWTDIKAAYSKAKGDGEARIERISIGENKDIYVSEKGDEWHVTRLPDGTTTKVHVRPDGSTGEIHTGGGKDSGK